MSFSLAAYLHRVSLPLPPEPDADGLAIVQRAHRLAIPFENLDVILGRPIMIDSASVAAKLVTARRGGYCFEQNRLFLDALAALGFVARPAQARVWLGLDPLGDEVPPLTHTFALVTIDGQDWIADAGFGGSYTPPLRLADGAQAESPDGARHRVRRDGRGWLVERLGDPAFTDGRGEGPGWQAQFGFDGAETWPADLALANHWVSTAPASRFTQAPIVSIVLPRGFASLNGRAYRRATPAETVTAEIASPKALRVRLSLLFGIDLAPEEVDALGLFPDRHAAEQFSIGG